MKILVLSDSHSALSFMRLCIEKVKPNAVVHLGDYYEDGKAMAEEFSYLRFYQVPGNCDKYRFGYLVPETLVQKVCGVKLFMTHGHNHRVKTTLWSLLQDARKMEANLSIFLPSARLQLSFNIEFHTLANIFLCPLGKIAP